MQIKGNYAIEGVSKEEAEYLRNEFQAKKKISIGRAGDVNLSRFVLGHNKEGILQLFYRNGSKDSHRIISKSCFDADVANKFLIQTLQDYRGTSQDKEYIGSFEFK